MAALVAGASGSASANGRFPREDVEDFLAVLVLSAPPEKLDDDAAALVGRFAARCGIARGAAAADVQAAIAAYLETKPLNEDIVAAVHTIAREKLAEGDVGAAVQRFTGVLGGGGERRQGTVPAGPMARFLVDKDKQKKK